MKNLYRALAFLVHSLLLFSCATTTPVIHTQKVDYLLENSINDMILPFNSKVTVQIDNINKKLVTIDNKVAGVDYFTTVPSLFEQFSGSKLSSPTTPVSGGLAPGEEASLVVKAEKILPSVLIESQVKQYIREQSALKKVLGEANSTIKDFKQLYNGIVLDGLFLNDLLQDYQQNCTDSFGTIEKLLLTRVRGYLSSNSAGNYLPANVNFSTDGYPILQSDLKQFLSVITRKMDNELVDLSAFGGGSNTEKIVKRLEENQELADEITKYAITGGPNDELTKIVTVAKQLVNLDKNKDNFAYFEDNYKQLSDKGIEAKFAVFKGEGIKSMMTNYALINRGNWTYFTPTSLVDKDELKFSIDIRAKDNLVCAPAARSYFFTVKANSGLKADFSTGLFFNFGGNDYMDQSYRMDPVANDPNSLIIVKNKAKNKIYSSVGALMHVYKRTDAGIKLAGSFGFSTKDIERVNIHFGPSLLIGKNNRMVVSIGPTIAKTALIDDTYTEGQVIPKTGAPTTIPTKNFTRWGYFFSVTYNLSK